jgi:polyisoprenoid-binding protein YceI
MNKIVNCLVIIILISIKANAQLYITQTGESSFFSETPLENVSAANKQVAAIVNITSGELAIKIQNVAFRFPNKLMEEHFNENYMETSKYPNATFKGKIQEKIDFQKNGIYDVSVKGLLDIHGVKQERTLKGKVTIEKEKITMDCNFEVKLVDHKIDIPTLVIAKIAESIAVKNHFVLIPKK